MVTFKITNQDWETLKIKLKRKYNTLSETDLQYSEGDEEALLDRLSVRLRRSRDYVFFTLSKELVDLPNNRL